MEGLERRPRGVGGEGVGVGRYGSWPRGAKGRAAAVAQRGSLDGTKEQFLHPSPSLGLALPGDSPQLPPSLQAPQPGMRRSAGAGSPATAAASPWSHQARASEFVPSALIILGA